MNSNRVQSAQNQKNKKQQKKNNKKEFHWH